MESNSHLTVEQFYPFIWCDKGCFTISLFKR